MVDDNELRKLRNAAVPAPGESAKARAFEAALRAYDQENISAVTQGSVGGLRLTERAQKLWSEIMQKKLIATPALAGLVALPIAGYATFHLLREQPSPFGGDEKITETLADKPATQKPTVAEPKQAPTALEKDKKADLDVESRDASNALAPAAPPNSESDAAGGAAQPGAPVSPTVSSRFDLKTYSGKEVEYGTLPTSRPAPAPSGEVSRESAGLMPNAPNAARASRVQAAEPKLMAPQQPAAIPADQIAPQEENRDRVQDFKTNPVHAALQDPVSTFSIDVDTASYSFVRGSLKQGYLPQADAVRVEEMINYFPYDWKGPESASTPFNSTVSVMPTPWNAHTKLMHVAIKGFDIKPTEQPKANLVFLIDVSGSMDEPDKLPLLKSAFRLLVSKLKADDTISIVTYAGDAGTVLMPTKVAEKDKILNAIDNLQPGGSTAGEAGIKEAYKLAQQSFIKDGVNRVMLATDGDFNVGQTDDDDLKRLIESERKTGVFLSVFGFGRGNLNDEMMQTIAQNGNGTAAYIDTLAEAEKVLVEDASSTLFTIAKDVKIQVEFNPDKVSEYRLIGYETRALNREDFNNDRVDAGDIGSGHSVTAIYEITSKGGGGEQIDPLRYGQATVNNGGVANADEYAFVKIRYKLPNEDVSKLITTPVTSANEVASFDQASTDQRFSVAVAAFGQKLRDEDATAKFGYDKIMEIATAARGADPFGYRSEFLSLVRLASALGGNR